MARLSAVLSGAALTAPTYHHALMLLGKVPPPYKQPGWTWEVEFDGFRMLAFREGRTVRLVSRNGRDSGTVRGA